MTIQTRVTLPLLILSTSLVLSGCDTQSELAETNAVPSTTSQLPKAAKSANPAKHSGTPKSRPDKARIIKLIRKNLDEDFGVKGTEPEWYFSIKKIEIDRDDVIVQTDLLKNDMFNEFIGGACTGVSNSVFDEKNAEWGLNSISVYSSNGILLARRNGITGTCAPY